MPVPRKYLADFNEHGIYHIYNRTNNNEKLFLSDENRLFFLKRYTEYLSPYLDTYCWCLLPNHFHFLVRMKSHKAITDSVSNKTPGDCSLTEKKFLENACTISELAEHAFQRFFQSYAQAFNKVHRRKGNLFYKPFKRVEVNNESHFTQAVVYIHANAVKHGLLKDFTKYRWSSWSSYLSDTPAQLLRDEVIGRFGSKEQFIKAHTDLVKYYYDSDVSIEE